PEMRGTDYRVDVPERRRVGGNDMDVDPEAAGMKADRLLHALGAIDRIECRMGVEHDLPVAVDRALACTKQLFDVGLLDLVAAKLDLDIGNVADEPAGTVARPDVVDGHPRHALGELDR